jgi:hypothetical protein
MKNKIILLLIIAFVFSALSFSCNKEQKPDQNQINQPQEQFVDKEKQLREKEELLKIKEESLNAREQAILKKEQELGISSTQTIDSAKTEVKDTTKIKKENDKNTKKEKELNKQTDNPKETISTYIEYLKRGISDPGKYDDNMKKANTLWENDRLNTLKSSYKNTTKIVVISEPTILTNKGNKASVKMKIKKSDKDKETDMTVTYYLVADKNGKWKIKSNTIEK